MPESVPSVAEPSQTLTNKIWSVLPEKNEHFTLDFVIDHLETAYPSESFNRASIRTLLYRLMSDGEIIRVQKGGGNHSAVYVKRGSDLSDPLMGLGQIEVAEKVLREAGRPLKTDELIVEMQRSGFKTNTHRRVLRDGLSNSMTRKPDTFHHGLLGWTVKKKKKRRKT